MGEAGTLVGEYLVFTKAFEQFTQSMPKVPKDGMEEWRLGAPGLGGVRPGSNCAPGRLPGTCRRARSPAFFRFPVSVLICCSKCVMEAGSRKILTGRNN